MATKQTEQKITALYERLSRDDDQIGDSNSISNQKIYLERYAADHGYTNIVHYTDDGWSGGNFNRPGWQQMVRDIEEGKVGTVLAKDMSRIGRNYLATGFYTEMFFRQHDVHFIAIANGIDSDNQSTTEYAPLLNVMNEHYLREQAQKVKTAYHIKGTSGKPTTNHAIYGYKKDPEDKDHWLIDDEAAAVVRRIYKMAVEGYGPYDISKALTAEKVESPSYYQTIRNVGVHKSNQDLSRPFDWYGETVKSILGRPEYMGHTVNFRTSKKSYKDKAKKNPPEEWMIFENTHDAIIDPETWHLVQKMRKTQRHEKINGDPNPLTGLVFCADCGAKMYNHRESNASKGKKPNDGFNCSTYTLTIEREKKACSSHSITDKALKQIILDTIRRTAKYALQNEEAFIEQVREAAEIKHADEAKELKKSINKSKRRRDELDVLLKKLYESYALEKMPEKRYEALSAEYEKEQAELEQQIAEMQAQLETFQADTTRIDSFMKLVHKYKEFSELTPAMITEFIDRIMVHAPVKIDGERTVQVDVYLNYIGDFQVPPEEMTPDEIAAAEALKKKRAKNRRKYERKKERDRLIEAGVIVPGEPYHFVCKMCGKTFDAKSPRAVFCSPACRERLRRREARDAKASQESGDHVVNE